ncbi:MAG: DUF4430 domain-containing protein [Lachnospiraceae bacterium]|nr:DUF4430 domain-containing protein [Lachnospiraceae bacterium]
MEKKNSKKIIIGGIILAALVALFFVCYTLFAPKAAAGSKNITIEVLSKEGTSTVYDVSTDAEYLRQAMEEADGLEFAGEDSEYGMTILEVNGEKADYNVDGAYWSILVNGEYGNYGADAQIVTDGDAFQIVYTVMK